MLGSILIHCMNMQQQTEQETETFCFQAVFRIAVWWPLWHREHVCVFMMQSKRVCWHLYALTRPIPCTKSTSPSSFIIIAAQSTWKYEKPMRPSMNHEYLQDLFCTCWLWSLGCVSCLKPTSVCRSTWRCLWQAKSKMKCQIWCVRYFEIVERISWAARTVQFQSSLLWLFDRFRQLQFVRTLQTGQCPCMLFEL